MAQVSSLHSESGQKYRDIKSGFEEPSAPWSSLFEFTTRKHIVVLFPAVSLSIIAGAIKPTVAIFLGYILDELTNYRTKRVSETQVLGDVVKWCLFLSGLGFSAWLINGGYFALWLIFGDMQAKTVREGLFIGLLEKDIYWYDLRANGIGPLLSRIQTQIRELQTATSQPLGFFIEDIAATLAALGIAFHASWRLTLLILACVFPTLCIVWLISRKLELVIEAQKRELTLASKLATTAITAIDIVKAFNGQEQESQMYKDVIRNARKSYLSQAHINSLQLGVTRFMTTAMFCAGFWYGASQINQGLSIGNILTAIYACLIATQSIESYQPQLLLISKGRSAGITLKRVMIEVVNGRRLIKMTGSLKPASCHGEVKVSNVSFSYPSNPGRLALDNTTFFLPAGQTTFVIGRSGSGKSTLGNILMEFYKPTTGSVFIDGYPIQTLDPNWIRTNVSLVQQKTVLFNETIFLNIAFGQPNYKMVTKDHVKMACQMALLQQTINDLPEGLDTIIGSDSFLISGGQAQRIAIARARLRDAPILILDEATSAMDSITRSLVMEAIRKWRKGKTTIIITHDSSQIADNDYLYVLEHGRIVQAGYRYELEMDEAGSFVQSLRGTPVESLFPDSVKSPTGRFEAWNNSKALVAGSVYGGAPDNKLVAQFRTHRRHISQFLSINNQNSESPRVLGRRSSYRFGMASAYANVVHAENVWSTSKANLNKISQVHLSKPLPPLPHEGISGAGKAVLSWGEMPTRFGLMEMGHHNNARSRSERTKLERSKTAELARKDTTSSKELLLGIKRFRGRSRDYVEGSEQQQKALSLTNILRTVWPNLPWKERRTLILGFVFALISAAATPAFSYVLSRLLGTFSLTLGQTEEAKKWGFSILGVAVADGLSTYFWRYSFEDAGQHWVDSLRVEALKRVLAQPMAWFDKEKNRSGHISDCLDRDVEEMRNIVGRFTGTIFMVGSMISIALVAAFVVCWKITLVAIATSPLVYILAQVFGAVSSRWEVRLNEASDAAAKVFSETFSNISTVRALTLEDQFKRKHAKAVQAAYKVGRKRAIYDGIVFGISNSTANFVTAIIIYYTAVIVVSGAWSIQNAIMALTLLLFTIGNATAAISFVPQISSSRATATRVLELANLPRTASHEASGRRYLRTPLPICLNSLSFTYRSRPETEVLHGVSMTFTAGSSTAIVGFSGSGKSTIAALLFGLYPPNEPLGYHTPSLTFAGNSIFSCNMQGLREMMAFVPQTPVIFPNTVAYNIAYGLREGSWLGSTHNIQAAAREAGIHEFIMTLPQGYNTQIGDGGQGMSGGQAQRIAISRALARRPMVLVLDEATSALDTESAEIIRDTIVRLSSSTYLYGSGGQLQRGNMAVIVITHSIDMMKAAGNVILLDGGRVVEQGRFSELAQKGGAFARLVTGDK